MLPENASEGVSLSGPVFGPQDRHSAGHSEDMPSSGPKGSANVKDAILNALQFGY
jgi:hypothetical protein